MIESEARNNVFAAIAKWSDKQFDRALLDIGDQKISVKVSAKCGRFAFDESLDLSLRVSPDSTQSRSEKLTANQVLATAFDAISKPTQDKIIAALAAGNPPSDLSKTRADLALKSTAKTSVRKIRGAVTVGIS